MRRLKEFKSGSQNPLVRWYEIKNPLVIAINFLVIQACRYLPFLSLKRSLYRLIGIKVGKNASIGLMAMFDIFFPELIEIGDNAVIGYNATIMAHEFLVDKYRVGKIKIGKNVMIGANTTVLAGVSVGDGAVVSAMSLVNKDVKKNSFVGGVPLRKLK